MRSRAKIILRDKTYGTVSGYKKTIWLSTGEVIQVLVHRPYESKTKEYWVVTHIETGLQICGSSEWYTFLAPDYYCDLSSVDSAVETARQKLNSYMASREETFEELMNKRLNKIEED